MLLGPCLGIGWNVAIWWTGIMITTDTLLLHVWSMATAAVVAASCALVGSFLVVRRMSLLGDAIAHAVLPGIAVGVLAGGRLGGPLVIAGAVAAALVTVWLTQALKAGVGLSEDAGAGVVFTSLFALGVVIITLGASRIDLDPDCVLFGILELAAFDRVSWGPISVPRPFVTGMVVLVLVTALLVGTWRMQVFTAFDTAAARAVGVPVGWVTTALLAATSVATVAGFEAVGAVLVVAMLVVPAATAELLVRRMHHVAGLAVAIAVAAACLGWLAAWRWNTSAAGMIAIVLGCCYAAAVILAPDEGLLARVRARLSLEWRVAREDWLARIWRMQETAGGSGGVSPQPHSLLEQLAAVWLRLTGRVEVTAGGLRLSPAAAREAETVVRSHRLWEAWLGRHAELPLDHLHPPAEWVEHHLGAAMRERIEAEMAAGEADPHGREIPPEVSRHP
ncbi:MAG: metal ABC transporter permease [Pirellulales bacterium]